MEYSPRWKISASKSLAGPGPPGQISPWLEIPPVAFTEKVIWVSAGFGVTVDESEIVPVST
jgi:hypothetical protein